MRKKLPHFIMLLLIIAMCYPIVFLVTGSFMGEGELIEKIGVIFGAVKGRYTSWSMLPENPNIWSYIKVLFDSPEFFTAFWNTIKIALITLALQCIVNISAAWGLAVYDFPGKKSVLRLYIILLILPFQVLMLPQYLVMDRLGLTDTIGAVILPMVFSPQFIFILYYFFKKIPDHIFDAARTEGASEWKIFIYIGLPLCRTGLLAAAVLSAAECFNIIEQPLLFFKTKTLWPLSLYLPNAKMDKVGENFVAAVLSLLPLVLVYLYGLSCIEEDVTSKK